MPRKRPPGEPLPKRKSSGRSKDPEGYFVHTFELTDYEAAVEGWRILLDATRKRPAQEQPRDKSASEAASLAD